MTKEMQTTGQSKNTIPQLSSVIVKMKFKKGPGLDFDARLNSDFDQSKLQLLA